MTRGVYTAAAGMLASQAAQDAIAQNLANAGTTGYKEDIPRFESFELALTRRLSPGGNASVGGLGSGVSLKDETTNFADGGLQRSGNPLDVALTGDAALVVQTPQGIRLTRDGSLSLDAAGMLVQANGNAVVLGDNSRPIQIPAKAKDIVIVARAGTFSPTASAWAACGWRDCPRRTRRSKWATIYFGFPRCARLRQAPRFGRAFWKPPM